MIGFVLRPAEQLLAADLRMHARPSRARAVAGGREGCATGPTNAGPWADSVPHGWVFFWWCISVVRWWRACVLRELRDQMGLSPLLVACNHGKVDVARWLVDEKSVPYYSDRSQVARLATTVLLATSEVVAAAAASCRLPRLPSLCVVWSGQAFRAESCRDWWLLGAGAVAGDCQTHGLQIRS